MKYETKIFLGSILIYCCIVGFIFTFTSILSESYAIPEENSITQPAKFDPFNGITLSAYIYDDTGHYYACNGFSFSEVLTCFSETRFKGNPIEIMFVSTYCLNRICVSEIDRKLLLPQTVGTE